MNSLVIVESGAKAEKIKSFLNKSFPDENWSVEACVGHVRDLAEKEDAVDPNDWKNLKWEFSSKGKKVMKELRKLCKESDALYLATDPDREGEAIAWHILNDFEEKKLLEKPTVHRITFNEITPSAVESAVKSPRDIDYNLVNAYLARRILDHLIGFKVSPLLWRHVSRAKSAGRVQSPTLRIICEKENERDQHIPDEYWPFLATFDYQGSSFEASLNKISDINIKKGLKDEEEVSRTKIDLDASNFLLTKIETKLQTSNPQPPFRTSSMIASANSQFGMSAKQTTQAAQSLFLAGHITYPRTDNISIAGSGIDDQDKYLASPLEEIRNYISDNFDQTFLSNEVRKYKNKLTTAQMAHEAIRPAIISVKPSDLDLPTNEERLYRLIWNRTVASQMESSKYERKSLTISSQDRKFEFTASSRKNIFAGFEVLSPSEEKNITEFPDGLEEGSELKVIDMQAEQKFSSPPNRYSEASLIKKMEEEGIGRPSTYATILEGLKAKKYIYGGKSMIPSDLGRILTAYLKKVFEDFFIETKFTANLEATLDEIASGNEEYEKVLNEFYLELQDYLNRKINEIEISNKDEFKTRQVLDLLNQELKNYIFPKNETGQIIEDCPKCLNPTISLKSGPYGWFVGCSSCKWTKKTYDMKTKWETYQELPKDLGLHPDLNEPIYADMTINGPCVWTMKEEKKIFGTPDEDEFILDIGLNRAIELIERSNAENVLFTEKITGIPVILKNGRFGEYTEWAGFNKATKLKPEDKEPSPKVSYYEPDEIDYDSASGRRYVLKSLRLEAIVFYKDGTCEPIGIKIRKPGKAFKFIKNLKFGDIETEVDSGWYKLDIASQNFTIEEVLKLQKDKKVEKIKRLDDLEDNDLI